MSIKLLAGVAVIAAGVGLSRAQRLFTQPRRIHFHPVPTAYRVPAAGRAVTRSELRGPRSSFRWQGAGPRAGNRQSCRPVLTPHSR